MTAKHYRAIGWALRAVVIAPAAVFCVVSLASFFAMLGLLNVQSWAFRRAAIAGKEVPHG